MEPFARYKRSLATAALAAVALNVAAIGAASASTFRGPVFPGAATWRSNTTKTITYHFTTLDNAKDPTFNQLLGINNNGEICGYFGIGSAEHPNKGYRLLPPYGQGQYRSENFPGSVQTQVVAINNSGYTAGFWADTAGNNFGFVAWNGVFTSYKDPHTTGTVNQVLGLNDAGIAVGFYTDSAGSAHGFMLNQATGHFTAVRPPSGTNVTAAGINNNGDITGFYTATNGTVVSFLKTGSTYTSFSVKGAMATNAFGINNHQTIVGSYLDSSMNSHGFVLTNPLTHAHFQSVDDPQGVGTTVINGVNDAGDLVGFYEDASTNFDGFLAKP